MGAMNPWGVEVVWSPDVPLGAAYQMAGRVVMNRLSRPPWWFASDIVNEAMEGRPEFADLLAERRNLGTRPPRTT